MKNHQEIELGNGKGNFAVYNIVLNLKVKQRQMSPLWLAKSSLWHSTLAGVFNI